MNSKLPSAPAPLDPDHVSEQGSSFIAAKFLFLGAEFGIFEKLGGGPLTLEQLAAATGLPSHSLRVLANGLTALGHLRLRAGSYENSPESQAFLSGGTEVDLRPGLRLLDKAMYPMWTQMENVIRTGEPARHGQTHGEFARIFSEGVESWTKPAALALPRTFDFSPHRRLLDVGGGTGSYLISLLEKYPNIRGTLFELSASLEQAKRRMAGVAVRERIDLVEGDVFCDPIPPGHDIALVAAVLHLFDPERITLLLRRVRGAVSRGAALLLADQWMDATCTEPRLGALLAGTYLMLTGKGATYSVDEARQWLGETGWRFVEHRPLAGAMSLVIAEAL
jgi:ubiquinone/menaquinone biosynthesis C-methylase UbiE